MPRASRNSSTRCTASRRWSPWAVPGRVVVLDAERAACCCAPRTFCRAQRAWGPARTGQDPLFHTHGPARRRRHRTVARCSAHAGSSARRVLRSRVVDLVACLIPRLPPPAPRTLHFRLGTGSCSAPATRCALSACPTRPSPSWCGCASTPGADAQTRPPSTAPRSAGAAAGWLDARPGGAPVCAGRRPPGIGQRSQVWRRGPARDGRRAAVQCHRADRRPCRTRRRRRLPVRQRRRGGVQRALATPLGPIAFDPAPHRACAPSPSRHRSHA